MHHLPLRRFTQLLISVLLLVFSAAPSAAGTMAELAAAIDAPAAGPAVRLDGPVRVGRGELTGGSARLLMAGGEPCGLLLGGPVTLRYTVEDRFSRPVAMRNLANASGGRGNKLAADGVLTATFQGAVVWGWELAAAAAGGAGGAFGTEGGAGESGAAPPAAGGALPPWAAAILDRPFFSPPSSELISARRLGGKGVAYALLGGGTGQPWLLAADPVDEKVEGIWTLDKLPQLYELSKGRHVAYELVAQPVDRQWWDRFPAPAIARRESILVDNRESTLVTVRTRTTIEATRPGLGVWRVDLADRTVVDNTEAPIRVLAVTVDGKPAEYVHQGSELLVALDPPLAKGATAEIEVTNAGHLAIRPGKDSYWVLSTWPWYPQPPMNGELAEVELEVRAPEPYTPFASGAVVERRSADGQAIVKTRLAGPSQFPVVAAGKYHVTTSELNGLTANVAGYAFAKEKESKRLSQLIFAGADVYTKLFGAPYPFDELDVVEINDWGFGQAPAGTIFITKDAYNPLSSITVGASSLGINEIVLHEVAHGWWAHVIKMDSLEEQWLTESFAEYSAALALEALAGGKKGEREFSTLLHRWLADSRQIGGGGSIYLANHLAFEDERDGWDRGRLLYAKGPLVLHALRQELGRMYGSAEQGDKYFLALLRSFIKNFGGGWGETRHLVGILDQITGKSWQPWFERYVYGTELPPIEE
jgi:hypothetical protein